MSSCCNKAAKTEQQVSSHRQPDEKVSESCELIGFMKRPESLEQPFPERKNNNGSSLLLEALNLGETSVLRKVTPVPGMEREHLSFPSAEKCCGDMLSQISIFSVDPVIPS